MAVAREPGHETSRLAPGIGSSPAVHRPPRYRRHRPRWNAVQKSSKSVESLEIAVGLVHRDHARPPSSTDCRKRPPTPRADLDGVVAIIVDDQVTPPTSPTL